MAQPNEEQLALWNGSAGQAWVQTQDLLDGMLEPFERLLTDVAAEQKAKHVLDVGCGTGATTLAIAGRLGAQAECTGIDISEPMIALAAQRSSARQHAAAHFIRADAQTHAFDPERFDLVVSRFGVMFFDDPVGAFANLRRAATPGAQLAMIVWRGAEENPFMTAAERAAAPYLPALPARRPGEPGQFAFADKSRVGEILGGAGWADVDIRPLDVECALPASELDTYATKLGPLGRVLGGVDERTRAVVLEKVRAAFEPYLHGAQIRFTAACWLVTATRS